MESAQMFGNALVKALLTGLRSSVVMVCLSSSRELGIKVVL